MSTIATQISLVKYSGPIFDQQQQGSCVANAICAAVALQANEYHQSVGPLARDQLYGDTRTLMGTFDSDSGSNVNLAFQAAETTGIANESSFAYNTTNEFTHPSQAVYTEAASQKVFSHTSLNIYQSYTGIRDTIATQLMQGKAVLVESFIHYGFGEGPSLNNPINGVHEYLIVGIDYNTGMYTVQNSWGTGWAQGGYGKIPFAELPGMDPANQPYGSDLLQLDVINGFKGIDNTWTPERGQVSMLYASLLHRCGENFGEVGWAVNLHNGTNIVDIANAFYNSGEGQTLYGTMSNQQFAASTYNSNTGRVADQAAIDLFAGQLNNGMSRGNLAYNLMHWVDIGNDTQAAADRLHNMQTVSENYGITMQIDGTHISVATEALRGVTDDANTVQVALTGIQHNMGWM